MPPGEEASLVTLRIPAKPEYVALARLALGGLLRRVGLPEHERADLKLAISEAAIACCREEDEHRRQVTFGFRIEGDLLVMDVTGGGFPSLSEEEQTLGRAIIEAVVDEYSDGPGAKRLVKRLSVPVAGY